MTPKTLVLAVLLALVLMALGASSASATTLEVGGVAQSKSIEIRAWLEENTSFRMENTSGDVFNTCTSSELRIVTLEPFTASAPGAKWVGGPVTNLTFGNCTNESVAVDNRGNLSFEWTSGTNGTVRWSGASITVSSIFGSTLNCTTNLTHIGTLTGVTKSTEVNYTVKHATLDVNAVLNCGFLMPSARWTGSYTVISPTGFGITA
jgi:hypothetical protein